MLGISGRKIFKAWDSPLVLVLLTVSVLSNTGSGRDVPCTKYSSIISVLYTNT